MRIRRLPDTDLARFAALEGQDALETALRNFKRTFCPWSYGAARSTIGDLLHTQLPLIGPTEELTWPELERQIIAKCRNGEDEINANIAVARALFDYRHAEGWNSAHYNMGSVPVSFDHTAQYWHDIVVEDHGSLVVPCFDFRRSPVLKSDKIRQIVFTIQHIWVRERHPDLYDARLCIVSFSATGKARTPSKSYCEEADLLSYDDLNQRIKRVYETWANISEENTNEIRRTGTGGTTPLGF